MRQRDRHNAPMGRPSPGNYVEPLPIVRRCAPDEARCIRAFMLLLDLGKEENADQADKPPEAPPQAAQADQGKKRERPSGD